MEDLELRSRGLTSEDSYAEILKLYNLCFDANSLCDRIVYVCSIKFNMIRFADWFHQKIAHAFTGDSFADGIEAFGELRGDLFYRGEITRHSEDYASVTDAMKSFVLKVTEIEKQCRKAIHTCADSGDEGYEDFLREFNMTQIATMLKQAMVLYNATKDYELHDNLYKWNKDFHAWIIPAFMDGDEDEDK